MQRIVVVAARALLALLFILAGLAKAITPAPFLEHMHRFDVPSWLLPGVIVLELGAGLALLLGVRMRDAALALSAFCLLTAAIFHHQWDIAAERTLFLKDLAIAGGLLALAAQGIRERTSA
jgi:putative oxidoreductase